MQCFCHVSIRRADRCLVEAGRCGHDDPYPHRVSIRRADRCLVEAYWRKATNKIGAVSIRRADRCLVEVLGQLCVSLFLFVSIRRADRCLVEAMLKSSAGTMTRGFNPPCGSLFG